jgi:hypothetical protein
MRSRGGLREFDSESVWKRLRCRTYRNWSMNGLWADSVPHLLLAILQGFRALKEQYRYRDSNPGFRRERAAS